MTQKNPDVAYGGVSILHAAGCGWGCSTPVELSCTAEIKREENEHNPEDDGLLTRIHSSIYSLTGHKIDQDISVSITSDVPSSMGLKSSSAVAVSSIKCVTRDSNVSLDPRQIVEVAADMQIRSGCSMTGSYDDNWAALGYNSAIVRTDSGKPSSPVGFFRLRKLNCTILDRGVRGSPPTKSDFEEHSEQFQVAKNTLMKGDVIEAFKLNGLAVAEATRDYEGKDLLKSLDSVGLASTITGSGPSIAILHEDDQIDLVSDFCQSFGRVITTKVLQQPLEVG